ncbi:unnamed protein product [Ectocarpus sp. CCAP 1310/34]|nr:unnamed protein product [Ectocarpus sp. CCAP 1310/34]
MCHHAESIARYTDRDDAVLTTDAAVDTTVCEQALKHGRTLVALVPDFGTVDSVRQKVGKWEEEFRSGERRPWARETRPINIPHSNVPRNVPREVAVEVASRQPQHAPHAISPEQEVAAMAANEMGLEIKV